MRFKRTTTEAELRLWVENKTNTIGEIAYILGCRPALIYSTLQVLGISYRRRAEQRKLSANETRRVIAGFKSFESLRSIAAAVGLSTYTLSQALNKAGLPSCAAGYHKRKS